MRRIVAGLFVSLDGVVEAPESWTGPYFNDEIGQEIGSQMGESDTLLLGRKTYETFAASFAGQSGGMADQMNAVSKVVVSTTLDSADWVNSSLIRGLDEVEQLKHQAGRTIGMSGSATLVRSLLRDALLDELRMLLFPVVVGSGQHLFENEREQRHLKLIDSTSFSTGVVRVVYEPAAA